MDSSPLVKAHDHARAAALAHTDSTVAISEHALAAGEFSNAARATNSTEALRTLKLLEEHHRKLSELLKLPLGRRPPGSSPEGTSHELDDASEKSSSPSSVAPDDAGRADSPGSPPSSRASAAAGAGGGSGGSSQQRRYPPSRELSSSIASNLASARGIRSKYRGQPLAPSVSSESAPGSLDGTAHKDGTRSKMQNMLDQKGKPSWVPPTPPTNNQRAETRAGEHAQEASPASPSDEGYSRFYNTFGSLINRLSAPLAFAGLPLIAEESAPEVTSPAEPAPTPKKQQRTPTTVSADPDLSRIYSKATLRALGRDGHGANDSFYFVPATGGTVSYANILSFDQKEKRRIAASVHGGGESEILDDVDDEDFVDARELHASMSPGVKRRVGRSQSSRDLQNAVEELYHENKGLKEMLDRLSKRLHAFEANAQNSHLALQSSMRFMRPGSPLSSSSSGGKKDGSDDAAVRRRNQELEEELAMVMKSLQKLEQENVNLTKINGKYRDRWEELKTKAKAKRATRETGSEAGDGPN